MSFVFSFWVPERPSSFRNTKDSRWWRAYIQQCVKKNNEWDETLTGSPVINKPTESLLQLDVLHLYVDGTLRDVDNTAKPMMDAFNKIMYKDDKQIRDLKFRSLKFDCEAAHLAIQSNEHFKIYLRKAVFQAQANGELIEDLTFVVCRDISETVTRDGVGHAAHALPWDIVRKSFKS
jgi:Holliday junction resolvase RusA-like endonuclease